MFNLKQKNKKEDKMLKKMFAVFSLFVVMMPLVAFAEGTPSSAGVVAGIESSELLADALAEGASVQVAALSQDEMEAVEAGSRFSRWRRRYRREITHLVATAVACYVGVCRVS